MSTAIIHFVTKMHKNVLISCTILQQTIIIEFLYSAPGIFDAMGFKHRPFVKKQKW
jgi:hypothetical protein